MEYNGIKLLVRFSIQMLNRLEVPLGPTIQLDCAMKEYGDRSITSILCRIVF